MALDALRNPSRLRHALVQCAQGAARGDKEGRTGRGQRHAAVGAHEQRRTHGTLQLADRLAQRRLRHMQPLGSTIEVQLFSNGDELLEQAGLDHCNATPRVCLDWAGAT
ncbi:hypothetical protein D3C72_1808100 [compost metagenome]